MSLMAFPVAPSDGDVSGKWVYDAAQGSWVLNEGAITLSNSSTDDLAEGTGNLYYTTARVDSDIASNFLIDEDAMTSDDATKAPSQQSVKAYVDNELASGGHIATGGIDPATLVTEADAIASNDNDTTIPTSAAVKDLIDTSLASGGAITTAGIAAGSLVTEAEGIASNDNDTTLPTSAAVKDLVDTSLASGGVITTAGIDSDTLVTEADGIGSNDNDTTIPTSAAIVDYVASANAATATSAGQLTTSRNINGVAFDGTSDVSNTFDNGVQLSGSTISMTGSYDGDFTATGDITAFSDKSLKSSIVPILEPMDKVKELTGYTFVKKGQLRRTTGLIAQEVEAVIPEAVHEHDDGLLSVAYGNLVGLLVESIKELNARVEELESK